MLTCYMLRGVARSTEFVLLSYSQPYLKLVGGARGQAHETSMLTCYMLKGLASGTEFVLLSYS